LKQGGEDNGSLSSPPCVCARVAMSCTMDSSRVELQRLA
jgi:hypothetical protein